MKSLYKKLYDEYLGEPGGHKAHELLHTHYIPRGYREFRQEPQSSREGNDWGFDYGEPIYINIDNTKN